MNETEAADLSSRHIEHFISIKDKNSPAVTGLILWAVNHDCLENPGVVRLTVGIWRNTQCVIEVPSEWTVTVGPHIHEQTP